MIFLGMCYPSPLALIVSLDWVMVSQMFLLVVVSQELVVAVGDFVSQGFVGGMVVVSSICTSGQCGGIRSVAVGVSYYQST